jgi:inner membrane protein
MVGKSHQLVGFASVYSLALLTNAGHLNTQTLIASIFLITLGSLTPDLDSQENKLYTLIPIGHKLFSEIGERAFGKHRSISHSLIGITIFGYVSHFLIYKIPPENGFWLDALWYSYFVSLVSHLVADALTKDGIPLLWPIKWKFGFPPLKGLRMRTGGFVEIFIVRTLILVYLCGLTYFYWPAVKGLFGF